MNIENIKITIENEIEAISYNNLVTSLLDIVYECDTHPLYPVLDIIEQAVNVYDAKLIESNPLPDPALEERISLYEGQEINPSDPFYDALHTVYELAEVILNNTEKNLGSHFSPEYLTEQKNALAIVHDYLINHPLAD